ncbi:type I restriction endonuclease subunit R, EcoR124 family, partial [Streptococcus suis]
MTIRASLGNGDNEDFIVKFIRRSYLDSFVDKTDIIEKLFLFARKEQKKEVAELIQQEG